MFVVEIMMAVDQGKLKDPDPVPVSVDLIHAENCLQIHWADGTQSRLTGEELRWACPCAECHGESGMTGRLDLVDRLEDAELKLADVGLIGQYALRIGFASGHDTGIYTFHTLRGMGRGHNTGEDSE